MEGSAGSNGAFRARSLRVGTARRPSHRDCLRRGERSRLEEEREGSSLGQRVWRETPFRSSEQISDMAEFRIVSMEKACVGSFFFNH